MANDPPADRAPPELRNDLILHRGPVEADGAPTWTLYDPSGNRFFRIGWMEFECLARFGQYKSLEDIRESINAETALNITDQEIMDFIRFLSFSELLVARGEAATTAFIKRHQAKKKSFWKHILHGYLFFILPLVNPDRFLRKTLPFISPLFTKKFFTSILILLLIGLYLTAKRWDEFFNTFVSFFSWEGLAFYAIAIACVKIMHELSHAYMAAKHGVRVSSMGIAFIVLYPVLFTETTGSWKLSERKGRLLIGAAGVLAEISIAAIALMIWHIFPDGAIRSTAFFVATVSLAGSLLINLNPFMRFDGYYLLSDALGVDNLQARAFASARWKMRSILFGWRDPIPEIFAPPLNIILLIYAYGTWIYRFFLFLGIAVLVYVLFFKPLGPFLMGVELTFFLALPIYREIKIWWMEREKMNWNRNTRILSLLAGLCLLAFIVPWRGTVDIPAIIQASQYQNLHSAAPARIENLLITQGQKVKKGDLLIALTSTELTQKIQQAKQSLKALQQQKLRGETNRELVQHRPIINRLIAQAQSTLAGYKEENAKLTIHAPFDGTISDLAPNLHKGRWVGEDMVLIRLVNFDSAILHGYVHEEDANHIKIGNTGMFYPDNGALMKPLRIEMTNLSKHNTPSLSRPDFLGAYGGAFAAQGDEKAMIPRDTLYAASFAPIDPAQAAPPNLLRGHINLKGKRQSAALYLLRYTAALLIRESGF